MASGDASSPLRRSLSTSASGTAARNALRYSRHASAPHTLLPAATGAASPSPSPPQAGAAEVGGEAAVAMQAGDEPAVHDRVWVGCSLLAHPSKLVLLVSFSCMGDRDGPSVCVSRHAVSAACTAVGSTESAAVDADSSPHGGLQLSAGGLSTWFGVTEMAAGTP
ncbi:unnamed protein product [Closterium sp. NIES-54]